MRGIVMKQFVSLLLSLLFVFSPLVGCSDSDPLNHKTEAKALESILLDKDLTELSELNGIVKIDSVSAGLDTYSFDTYIFDLKQNKLLCTVSFSEGAWVSGLTEKGFYTVDTAAKVLTVYDRFGAVVKEQALQNVAEPINFCALSENEKIFLYSNAKGSQITRVDLSDLSQSSIDVHAPLRDVLSFRNDVLRAVSIDGRVLEIDLTKASCACLLDDKRVTLYSPDYCLGETETNFLAANADADYYIPISSADEIFVGIWGNGFATTAFSGKHCIRIYDLKSSTLSYCYSTLPVEKVCRTSGGSILAVVGSAMEKKHRITILSPSASEALTLLTQDVTLNTEGETEDDRDVTITPTVMIKNVPLIPQMPSYPTGCEAVSTVMALQYAGYAISVEDFITQYLPKSREFYIENGKNFGPDPYEYFIGNPKSAASYGCMAPVIEKALGACLEDTDKANNITGMSLPEICEQYVKNGTPVILWATIKMRETNPVNSWYLSDGTRFTWPGNEHCMLLVGYDDTSYYFHDPYTGKLASFEKQLCEDRFAEMGRQALVIMPQ